MLLSFQEFIKKQTKNCITEKLNNLISKSTLSFDVDKLNMSKLKGHYLDNIPKNIDTIQIPSKFFEQESETFGVVSINKIAYHRRPIDDKYWLKNIHKLPPVLVGYDEEHNQLRVKDGNHRLNIYLTNNYTTIPVIFTPQALSFINN